ncbi:zinc-dependent alcohol dehydrogenase [Novosphingobium decolorationis]|uniref:Alcohol dehydrogenase catalytic domain-containing protein n=1 Tax=Novosphingobium decolorationis TaxID=2698673 RepID=A0ABX8E4U6_9SPHN|nr:alcohol dehydrogenase catalytic domain-containing protein [Novosphingobium decolorationis]QVM83629.1 alcohol dehydrogenase catalytic domain-containing protein [Novosphingobium decolorationis]
MKAARLHAPGDIRVEDVARPEPGPGQVLVQVMAYAPYGTDVGTYLNRGGRYVKSYPVGIGADFSGIVAQLGAGVEGLAPGDRVSALALDHCGACANCTKGRHNLCLDPAFRTPVRQTCCEEYTLVSARKLAVLPDAVGFEDAAMLAGPVDALNAFRRMRLEAGQRVGIVGVGAMGLGAVAMARALGLEVVAIGGSGRRSDLAGDLGAAHLFPIAAHGERVSERVLGAFPEGLDAVMETTASAWGMDEAFAVAAPGARVALTGGGDLPVSNWQIVERELEILGVKAGPGQVDVLEFIARGDLSLRPTITRRFALDDVAEAFTLLAGPQARDVGRVIIEIGETA